jgi:exopolyphosphatase/guanosine-5'-triphosphate,3'-diphosphate pyrophosphatase
LALRIAIVFMHSRIEIDFSELRLRLKTRIEFEIPRRYTEEHPTLVYWFEKEREAWAVVGIEFALKLS